jgi:hypothetical protein
MIVALARKLLIALGLSQAEAAASEKLAIPREVAELE